MKNELQCVIATTRAERLDVYRLRYECYRRKQAIEVREDCQFRDRFDYLPNQFSFMVRAKPGPAVATVRISVVKPEFNWTESPASYVYGDDPSFQRMAGESMVEANRLCFGPQARRDAFVKLLGHMSALADHFEVKWLVACPRVEHVKTYERMFGFQQMAAPRKYFGVDFQTQLLAISLDDLRRRVENQQPMKNAWSAAGKYLARVHRQKLEPAAMRLLVK